ncbi:MAG TPA: type II secretion system protein GspK [Bradyrhizobium sp.]|nr:type II secretion system protein GspK [Bradyrhizobium sp.]
MPLISVLWALGLLTAISLSLLWSSNVSYGLVRNNLETVRLDSVAEAAVNRAAAALLDPRPGRRWRTDGVVQNFEFDGTRINISIQDELGKIDLNQAEASLLVGLLKSADLDFGSADGLADKIVDWRTPTSLKRLNGAKEQEFREADSAYHPRNGPFQSVDELLLVMDMSPALFRRLEPALTVYSGRQFIDPQVAPREALAALPDMTPDKIDAVLASRGDQQMASGQVIGVPSTLRGRAFAIRIQFEKSNSTIRYEAVIRLTENPEQPYFVLSWRRL